MNKIKNQLLLDEYYENNAKKLRGIVDKILLKFGGIYQKDYDDFYSLANEVFLNVLIRYDGSKDFEGFVYSCLLNKIKTEITARNREKRRVDKLSVSLDTPIGKNEEMVLADIIPDKFDMETEFFERIDEGYSARMNLYLNRLSKIQKDVLRLRADGYSPKEIQKELHISEKKYTDCKLAIRAYRNVSILY